MTNLIQKAHEFAEKAHEGQTRWDGTTPYISHPESVAELTEAMGGDETAIIIAWLHDVIEDCDVTYDDLVEEFGTRIARGVLYLTKNDGQKYHLYIDCLQDSDMFEPILVKIADLAHNLLTLPVGKDRKRNRQRAEKYELARWVLMRELEHRNWEDGSVPDKVKQLVWAVNDVS